MASPLHDAAAIVGIGQTEFSKNSGRSELQLTAEAIKSALDDCGLKITPQNAAPGRPSTQNATPIIVPCSSAVSSVPTSVAWVTLKKRARSESAFWSEKGT